MAPGMPWTSHQQVELVDELCPNVLHAHPVFSQLLSWHKDVDNSFLLQEVCEVLP